LSLFMRSCGVRKDDEDFVEPNLKKIRGIFP
jgi:hypothetical protein